MYEVKCVCFVLELAWPHITGVSAAVNPSPSTSSKTVSFIPAFTNTKGNHLFTVSFSACGPK